MHSPASNPIKGDGKCTKKRTNYIRVIVSINIITQVAIQRLGAGKGNCIGEFQGLSRPIQKDVLPSATMWMNLDHILLSDTSQAQKDKYCMISFTCGI